VALLRDRLMNSRIMFHDSNFLLDRATPYRTMEVRARAHITPDTDYSFDRKLGAKYGGADFSTRDRPGETRVIVSLQPVKVNIWGK
jgi:hypothetical protein